MAKTSNTHKFNGTITVNQQEVPVGITLTIIPARRNLKAVVAVDYCGLHLNDIRILEDYTGDISVSFPTREFTAKKTGTTRVVSVFYPYGEVKTALHHLILNCYTEALSTDSPLFTLIDKDGTAENVKTV